MSLLIFFFSFKIRAGEENPCQWPRVQPLIQVCSKYWRVVLRPDSCCCCSVWFFRDLLYKPPHLTQGRRSLLFILRISHTCTWYRINGCKGDFVFLYVLSDFAGLFASYGPDLGCDSPVVIPLIMVKWHETVAEFMLSISGHGWKMQLRGSGVHGRVAIAKAFGFKIRKKIDACWCLTCSNTWLAMQGRH